MREFVVEHGAGFEDMRRNELKEKAAEFCAKLRDSGDPAELAGFRDSVGLNSMRRGLGYVVQAVANGRQCPCVYEDNRGRLYFAVPLGVTELEIRGRKLADGSQPFSGKYSVTIRGATTD